MENVWRHDEGLGELVYDLGRGCEYRVELADCGEGLAVLDWILQVSHKAWANDQVLADLVRGLDRILDPQRTMCGGAMRAGRRT